MAELDEASSAVGEWGLPQDIEGFSVEALLGEGRAGPVYLARQKRPERRVVLRVLTGGWPDADGRERLRREIAQLTGIEHPGIPRLLGTGTWSSAHGDHPYLVLECIEGRALAAHCDQLRLGIAYRMALVARIAHTVHHLHTYGVVHGGLTAHNILVTPAGEPRVLDFGVGAWRGTAGNEPVGGAGALRSALFVDPAVDLQALGQIATGLATAVKTAGSANRVGPARLPTDLQAVLARALAQPPEAQYGSALEFALDLERWLGHHPVEARLPGPVRRLLLFVRRHRVGVALGGVGAAALAATLVISLRVAGGERQELARTQTRAQELAAANHFLGSTLLASDRSHGENRAATVRSALDQARAQLLEAQDMPDSVDVRIRALLGEAYANLGDVATGLPMQEEAMARADGSQGIDPLLHRQVAIGLARTLVDAGQATRAAALLKPLLAEPAGSDSETRGDWVRIRTVLAEAAMAGNDADGADRYLAEADGNAEHWFGPMSDPALEIHADHIMVAYMRERFREVLRGAQHLADQIARTVGPQHPVRANMLALGGLGAREMDDLGLARRMFLEAAQVCEALYGADATRTLDNRRRVAELDHGLHPGDRAPVAELRRVMDTESRRFGPNARETIAARVSFASAALDVADPGLQAEGERILQETVDGMASGTSPRSLATLSAEFALARRLELTGRSDGALHMYREVRSLATQALGPQHRLVFRSATATAELLEHLRLAGEARQEYAELLPQLRKAYGEKDPRTRQVAQRLAALGPGVSR